MGGTAAGDVKVMIVIKLVADLLVDESEYQTDEDIVWLFDDILSADSSNPDQCLSMVSNILDAEVGKLRIISATVKKDCA